jgi:hypothetical protein
MKTALEVTQPPEQLCPGDKVVPSLPHTPHFHPAYSVLTNEVLVTESWRYNHYLWCGGNSLLQEAD